MSFSIRNFLSFTLCVFLFGCTDDYNYQVPVDSVIYGDVGNLRKLCKTWSVVKYFGDIKNSKAVNWDKELFRLLEVSGTGDFERQLLVWVDSLCNLKIYKTEEVWTLDYVDSLEFQSKELVDRLNLIYKSSSNSTARFIDYGIAGNPKFEVEENYSNLGLKEPKIRLLALFRFWAIIEFFYPHKSLVKAEWSDILDRYILDVLQAEDELACRLLFRRLSVELGDSHAYLFEDSLLSNFFGYRALPFELWSVEGKVVVSRIFDPSLVGVNVGGVVVSLESVPIDVLVQEKLCYSAGSNQHVKMRNALRLLTRSNKEKMTVSFLRDSLSYTSNVNTGLASEFDYYRWSDVSFSVIYDSIGYLYAPALDKGEIDELKNSIMELKALIIDLRGYPGDFIVYKLGDMLMDEEIVFGHSMVLSANYPGEMQYFKSYSIGGKNSGFNGMVCILVNERTQSQSEFTAQALSCCKNSFLIGSETAGADGNASYLDLPGDMRLMITGTSIYTKDWASTQKVGLTPDLQVKPTISGLRLGIDEVLDSALAIVARK